MNQATFEEKMRWVNHSLEDTKQDERDKEYAAMTLPKRGTCIVDDDTAIMDKVYFEELKEYSLTMPTGVFIGKRWKRNRNAGRFVCDNKEHTDVHKRTDSCILSSWPEDWWMLEYAKHPTDPKIARTISRKIIIV